MECFDEWELKERFFLSQRKPTTSGHENDNLSQKEVIKLNYNFEEGNKNHKVLHTGMAFLDFT